MVDVCLLGCGGSMPTPYRSLSASLISFKGRKILVDCGEGTQVSMKQVGWGFKSIDIICITHSHGDHTIGLPGLLSTIGNAGRTEPITIIGPEGISEIVNGLRVVAEYLPYEIKIIESPKVLNISLYNEGMIIEESTEKIRNMGQIQVKTLELEHSASCLGYSFYFKRGKKFNVEKAIANKVPKVLWSRLQREENVLFEEKEYRSELVLGEERKGIKISIVTDTRPMDEIPQFIFESDLFICEGTYGDDRDEEKAVKYKHMTFRESAALAKAGEVKQLLLTHFSPAMMEPAMFLKNAEEVFGNVVIGEDRMILNLNFEDGK